jgi:phosphoglycolate phosphatase
VAYALRQLGFQVPPAERMVDMIGLSLPETFVRLTGDTRSEMASRFAKCFHEHADQIIDNQTSVYGYVAPVLEVLKNARIRSGVVSTKLNYRVLNILRKNCLDQFFDVIVGGDDVVHTKPDPEGLVLALKRLGVSSAAALYVGDHVIDGEAARKAGVKFVAVLSGRHGRDAFLTIPHLAILENLNDLPGFLDLVQAT